MEDRGVSEGKRGTTEAVRWTALALRGAECRRGCEWRTSVGAGSKEQGRQHVVTSCGLRHVSYVSFISPPSLSFPSLPPSFSIHLPSFLPLPLPMPSSPSSLTLRKRQRTSTTSTSLCDSGRSCSTRNHQNHLSQRCTLEQLFLV